ncbi:MAG: hypothetical protein NTV51_29085 [Verrucomicrobia bacterium]|nr:hypothetical protein [Verrucomicrobiota bacterium]
MIATFRRQFSPLRSVSASLALLAFAGCETDRPRRGPPAPEAGAAAPAPVPEMSARAVFFAGQLETEVLLSRTGFGPRGNGKDGAPSDGEGRGRGGFGGGFGGKRGGGGGPRGGGGGEGGPPGEGRGGSGRSTDGEPVPRIVASNQPPVRLHLRLTNRGADPVEVEVLDFNSDLGNFVVQPKKIAIAPGASAEADPMTSRLGVPGDAIPLTVRLRLNGKIERQVLTLQIIAPASPAPTPPAPPTPPSTP